VPKITEIVTTDDQSSITNFISKKRHQNNTLSKEFLLEKAITLAIRFILQNNLAFNVIDSSSFKELLSYYSR
jgi:hypothetical protein